MTSSNLDLFKMALGLEDPWKVTRTDFTAGEPVQVVQTLPVLVEPRPHLRVRTRIVPPGGKLGGHTSKANLVATRQRQTWWPHVKGT
jgi:hypothetical protein